MAHPRALQLAADQIIAVAFADSRVVIDREELMRALEDDFRARACRYPTDEECDEMVTGGDDGEPDEELCATFQATSDLIATYW